MRNWWTGLLWGAALGLLAVIGFVSLRSADAHATPCAQMARPPSAAVLRAQVIRSQLHALMQANAPRQGQGSPHRLLLIRGDASREAMGKMLLNRSLPAWLATAYQTLESAQQIDALTDDALAKDTVIVNHDVVGRSLTVIPTRAMQLVPGPASLTFTPEEQARGFGKYFVSTLQYGSISLACCDGKGPLHGLDESWFAVNTDKNIRGAQMKVLAVNACGQILKREYDGDVIYVF